MDSKTIIGSKLDVMHVYWSSSSDWLSGHLCRVFDRLQGHRRPHFSDNFFHDAIRICNRLGFRFKEFLARAKYNIKTTDFLELSERLNFYLRSKITQPNLICFAAGVSVGIVIGYCIAIASRQFEVENRMRCLVCTAYGGHETVALVDDFPAPSKCGRRDVVIQVKAAGIDTLDVRISSGYGRLWRKFFRNKGKHSRGEFPFILGRDCSGLVVEIGSSVTHLEVGDNVWAAVPFWSQGTLAEVLVLPADWVGKKPTKLGHEASAAVPFSGLIAWRALLGSGAADMEVLKSRRILIHCGSTAVGCLAIQLAKECGADVTATMPSQSLELAARLELDDVYAVDDARSMKMLGMTEKFDIVVNCCGHDFDAQCLNLCSKTGRVVNSDAPNLKSDNFGFIRRFVFNLWFRSISIFWLPSFDPAPDRRILDQWAKLIDDGRIQPVVDRAFPFHSAEAAFHFVARPNPVGKTVVVMRNRLWSCSEDSY